MSFTAPGPELGSAGPQSSSPPIPAPFCAPPLLPLYCPKRLRPIYFTCCHWIVLGADAPSPLSPPSSLAPHPLTPSHPVLLLIAGRMLSELWLRMPLPSCLRGPKNASTPQYLFEPCDVTDWCRWMLRVLWRGMHTGPTRPALRSRRAGRAVLGSSKRLRTTCAPPRKPSTGECFEAGGGRGGRGGEVWQSDAVASDKCK